MLDKLATNIRVSSTLSSKYGHFWLQKSKMVIVKMQTRGKSGAKQLLSNPHGGYIHDFLQSVINKALSGGYRFNILNFILIVTVESNV